MVTRRGRQKWERQGMRWTIGDWTGEGFARA